MLTPSTKADESPGACQSTIKPPLSTAALNALGWTLFDGFDVLTGSATHSNPRNAQISGLSYNLSNPDAATLMLRIDAWRFNKRGETTALTVMELHFNAAGHAAPNHALQSLKVMARNCALSPGVTKHAIAAALFLMGQIRLGHVPDYERVLELHRLHPGMPKGGINSGINNRA